MFLSLAVTSMACGVGGDSVTFSVSVKFLDRHDDSKPEKYVVKNVITRFQKSDTWFDVFEIVTEDIAIPKSVDETFEKIAKVKVSKTQSTETFTANPYDQVSVITDFDSSMKYVLIEIDNTEADAKVHPPTSPEAESSAFDVLMSATPRVKASKIPQDKPRFSGNAHAICNHCLPIPQVIAGTLTFLLFFFAHLTWQGGHQPVEVEIPPLQRIFVPNRSPVNCCPAEDEQLVKPLHMNVLALLINTSSPAILALSIKIKPLQFPSCAQTGKR